MTEWSDAVAYRCRHCKEHTIETEGSPEAEARECAECHVVPVLEDAPEAIATDGGWSS